MPRDEPRARRKEYQHHFTALQVFAFSPSAKEIAEKQGWPASGNLGPDDAILSPALAFQGTALSNSGCMIRLSCAVASLRAPMNTAG